MSDSASNGNDASVRSEIADDLDFRELLLEFAETIPEKQESLRALHRDGAIDEIRIRAHQLKGSGGGYGFPGLSASAAELEQACKTHDADQIVRSLDALIEYLGRIEV